MIEFLAEAKLLILKAFSLLSAQLVKVISYPIDEGQRIYWLYLLSSVVFAAIIYLRQSNNRQSLRDFLRFLFPAAVWRHPSAWLDVRYFFFHQVFRLLIYGIFLGSVSVGVYAGLVKYFAQGEALLYGINADTPNNIFFTISFVYMFVAICATDFFSYCLHYLQHKNPFLWEFHKVHHSAEVMHPLSNYREHPFDNLLYAVGTGGVLGLMAGIFQILFGYVPQMPQIIGVSGIYFLFNILGYNLRHSHIWLRWPGKLSYLFGSPAHHQVHHSYHPDHINKNFAFIFPWWDAIFGTMAMPEDNRDVKFGISKDYVPEYSTVLQLYYVPILNVIKGLKKKDEDETVATELEKEFKDK